MPSGKVGGTPGRIIPNSSWIPPASLVTQVQRHKSSRRPTILHDLSISVRWTLALAELPTSRWPHVDHLPDHRHRSRIRWDPSLLNGCVSYPNLVPLEATCQRLHQLPWLHFLWGQNSPRQRGIKPSTSLDFNIFFSSKRHKYDRGKRSLVGSERRGWEHAYAFIRTSIHAHLQNTVRETFAILASES